MIFDTNINESAVTDWSAVKESQYPLGLEGALMHVYENECNYNAIIKSAGLAELKYCVEGNQGELFVNEAGAFSGFLTKAKEFFKKVIEKIKAMFKKFFMVINSYTQSDKEFVKKYSKALYRVDMTDFEFKGYEFGNLEICRNDSIKDVTTCVKFIAANNEDLSKIATATIGGVSLKVDNDKITDLCDKLRGDIINDSPMNESEFRDTIKEKLYGDGKETLEDIKIREQLAIISDTKETIKKAEKLQKEITRELNDLVKALEKASNGFGKVINDEKDNADLSENRSTAVTVCNTAIKVAKSVSNDYTVAFGMTIQALKDQNRQAKAICVKAINYKPKNEAAYSEGGIFDGVVIQ